MTSCEVHASGTIELYFYDELDAAARRAAEIHLESCTACRAVLADLDTIRNVLKGRPEVSSPPAGDWGGFMSRLDASIADERNPRFDAAAPRASYVTYLAIAALLALVTFTAIVALRTRPAPAPVGVASAEPSAPVALPDAGAFQALSEEHFERSKLVVLGLATKDPGAGSSADWAYERSLAASLLNDTRIYRQAAEDRGLTALAGVMRDLELVLLQASLTDEKDPASLPQLQRLIRKRDLLGKMDVVSTTGL